ncbi:hypothetical protein RXV95_00715 [Novosphingobium sp. ZN18A2]|uniref:hypothetical protein n=1 Tax=Novosphingobium sp. ZN18A2 TaxID=3079861 RepID=UPI0030CE0442
MSDGTREDKAMTREERLAAQLRGNLRRRKAQARAMAPARKAGDAADSGEPGLPKTPRDS